MNKRPLLIGIAGGKSAGKTTLANFLHVFEKRSVIRGFSEPVKQLCNEYLMIEGKYLWGTEDEKNVPQEHLSGHPSARRVMQIVGTDWFRAMNQKIWIAHMMRFLTRSSFHSHTVIIPDVRFRNECEFINGAGGIVIRLLRSPLVIDAHISESEIDTVDFKPPNIIIDNRNMSPEQTQECALLAVNKIVVAWGVHNG